MTDPAKLIRGLDPQTILSRIAELDSERFPLPLAITDAEFDQLVERSLAELPEPVRKHLEELPVMVEPLPTAAILGSESPPLPPDILGLFVGRDQMVIAECGKESLNGAIDCGGWDAAAALSCRKTPICPK